MSITSRKRQWSILKILSLLDSAQNFLQIFYYKSHHTLTKLLHYLVETVMFQKSHKSQNTVPVFMNKILLKLVK